MLQNLNTGQKELWYATVYHFGAASISASVEYGGGIRFRQLHAHPLPSLICVSMDSLAWTKIRQRPNLCAPHSLRLLMPPN